MTEPTSDLRLEIAHILFIDIVGYSKLLINEQHELLQKLNQVVRSAEAFRIAETAGKLVRFPTGDGMALVFSTAPDAPVQCALEISKALQIHAQLQVRMGVHSGPVSGITDVNDQSNVAGAGINMAQRVMDCGDAGHILVSKRIAEDLEQYRQWRPYLHDLGDCEVKHGVQVHLFNLYTADLGNPAVPEKLKKATHPANRITGIRFFRKPARIAVGLLLAIAGIIGLLLFAHHASQKSIAAGGTAPSSCKDAPPSRRS